MVPIDDKFTDDDDPDEWLERASNLWGTSSRDYLGRPATWRFQLAVWIIGASVIALVIWLKFFT